MASHRRFEEHGRHRSQPWPGPGTGRTLTARSSWARPVSCRLAGLVWRYAPTNAPEESLLFAQPLSRIVAMRSDQVTTTGGAVHVRFGAVPIHMPPILDDLIREHLQLRGQSPYGRDAGWLFPGGVPGRP